MNKTLTPPREARTRKGMERMSAFELRSALDKLSMSQADLARVLDMRADGVRRMCDEGGEGPSGPVSFAVRSLLRNHIPSPKAGVANGELSDDAARGVRQRLFSLMEDAKRAGWPAGSVADVIARSLNTLAKS